jgi:CRISPR type I-E-associated protein CasB/Cse2
MANDLSAGTALAVREKRDEIAAFADQIAHLPTGERAALRRMYLTGSEAAIGVVTGLLHRAGAPPATWRGRSAFGRWHLIAYVAAVLSNTAGEPAHDPDQALGEVLRKADFSENRLMRLIAAKGPALDDQVRRAAQFLAQSRAGPADLRTLDRLLSGEPAIAETARLQIAREYYEAWHVHRGDAP